MAEIKLEVSTSTENQNEVQALAVLLNSLAGNETVKTVKSELTEGVKIDNTTESTVKETAAEKRKRLAAEKKATEDSAKTESENEPADAVEESETTEESEETTQDDDKVDYGKLRDQAKELLTKKATIDGAKDKVRAKLAELNSKGISGLKDDQVQTFIDFLNTL